jgi:hypothetical protein
MQWLRPSRLQRVIILIDKHFNMKSRAPEDRVATGLIVLEGISGEFTMEWKTTL